jgi:hypothetical protein
MTDEDRSEIMCCGAKRHFRLKERAKLILWVIPNRAESWPK